MLYVFSFFRFDASGDNQELRTIKFLPGTSYPKTKKITGMCKKFPINISLDYIDVNNKVKKAAEYLVRGGARDWSICRFIWSCDCLFSITDMAEHGTADCGQFISSCRHCAWNMGGS